ncbi:helix-turn-helix domain-containing protein [Bacillus thuringiensis]|uniref:helix-turn-helix domain-containing protein n=1 Tax=Bacillus thuringiensis TaxID=1428 RepID=UPI000BF8172C|nr:hypothetical protein [Bacillus thuringiensis]PFU61987.1 hypothetical protein COK85_10255 [Bacillus thuringiensis]
MEKVRRKEPTKDTLRELYLKSGNRCAFPGCEKTILNDKGNVVGQICHIEAAMPGGERFNPNQTNEERRQASNLLLLCYEHHIETNDVEAFPVERMQSIKQAHEQTYGDVANKLFSTIGDITELQEYQYCTTLENFYKAMEWRYDKEDAEGNAKVFNKLVDDLRELSPETRAIFKIMLRRQKEDSTWINIEEIPSVTGKSIDTILIHIRLLEEKGFIDECERNDRGTVISNFAKPDGFWDIWRDIRKYTNLTSITLEEIIVNMNFSLLD